MDAETSVKSDMPAKTDISNKTIVVLVVLTVLISILSTLVVINEVSNFKIGGSSLGQQSQPPSNGQGKVSLTIERPDSAGATGRVIFNIK